MAETSNATMVDEFSLIERYFAPLAAGVAGSFGLTDDAAVLDVPSGRQLVVTTDCLIAGIHFRDEDPPEAIATKVLAVNLSDLAAMGAEPLTYLLAAAWPRTTTETWIERFALGLGRAQSRHHVTLVGGDTVATDGPLCLAVTALGTVEAGRSLIRGGARSGDRIYVSGTVGDAALGLELLKGTLPDLPDDLQLFLVERYQRPEPRLSLGRALGPETAHGVIDISDGLVADLTHVAAASGLAAEIDAARVPLSVAARTAIDRRPELLSVVLTGGDDYELLFAAPPSAEAEIAFLARSLDLPLTAVGRMFDGRPGETRVMDPDGITIPLPSTGFRHF